MQTFRSTALVAALALGLSACGQQASTPAAEQVAPLTEGAWTLDPADSRLSYVSIKAGEIAEANRFDSLAGSVAADGTAT
ncbi:MAG: YceI family protein, partial [Erythrobacter sp.]|nr:YceI family protein [Erythrobacter sp.]